MKVVNEVIMVMITKEEIKRHIDWLSLGLSGLVLIYYQT